MPWVVAHRGASNDFAEHTPAAIQRALDQGADGIECDVRLTLDGEVVLAHDATTARTANTQLRISRSKLTQLRALEYGAAHQGTTTDPDTSITSDQRRSLMTLYELLEVLDAQPRPVGLLVETKHPARNGKALEPYVARVLAHFGWNRTRPPEEPPIAVMSFSQAALQRMQRADEHMVRAWLTRPPFVLAQSRELPRNAQAIGPSIALLRRHGEWVARVLATGRSVYVWTVDTDSQLDAAAALGVTCIITNRPGWAKARLAGTV